MTKVVTTVAPAAQSAAVSAIEARAPSPDERPSSSMVFCYHCRKHHPIEEVRRVTTRSGSRWRCIASIEAAAASVEEREKFGAQMSAANRAAASRRAKLTYLLRIQMLQSAPGFV